MQLYYLGFQRAPPCIVTPGAAIEVAPTIVNDLRDDVYEPALHNDQEDREVCITLQWVVTYGDGSKEALEDSKLDVRWLGSATAYRPLALRVPSLKSLRRAAKLQLAVYPSTSAGWMFGLQSDGKAARADGSTRVVACLSDDITIAKQMLSGAQERSNRLVREFSIGIDGKSVCVAEQAGYALDKHLWDASLHFSAWLLADEGANRRDLSNVPAGQVLRIVELGAGTGLLSIMVGALAERPCSITATDLADALPLLRTNITANRHLFAPDVKVTCAELDWEPSLNTPLVKEGCDVVLVSDCTYNPAYFVALSRTISALLRSSSLSLDKPRCLLAKKHRHADEDSLRPALARHRLCASLVYGTEPIIPVTEDDHSRAGWGLYHIECDV